MTDPTELSEGQLVDSGALPPDDFHGCIDRTQEVASYDIIPPSGLMERVAHEAEGLLVDREALSSAALALLAGNIVLQGPPGTGKSSLARALCRAFGAVAMGVTAHEDWSTLDVIGHQELTVDEAGAEHVVPVNGFFTEAALRCAGAVSRHFDAPDEPQAVWLLIDELNRAHPDKAFGELFTVLGTDETVPVTLTYQHEGNRNLVVPRRFRIIATINSVDKQFVNSLSQGIRRRFTFITIDIPGPRFEGEDWTSSDPWSSAAVREFHMVPRRAAHRIRRRLSSTDPEFDPMSFDQRVGLSSPSSIEAMVQLFEFAEKVRYASAGSGIPYLPIGTAQLIDTVELFLTHLHFAEPESTDRVRLMDWAISMKLAPLFDTDTIAPSDLLAFASALKPPFDAHTRRELQRILAEGLYYVP